jgi:hypothetical protein
MESSSGWWTALAKAAENIIMKKKRTGSNHNT